MKKIISLTFILCLVLSSLISCKLFGKDDDKGGSNNQADNDKYIWSTSFESFIVTEEQTTDSENLKFHIFTYTEKAPIVISPSDSVKPHEIVLGDVGREISDEERMASPRAPSSVCERERTSILSLLTSQKI